MEVKIGIQNAPRELVVDVTASHDEITQKVEAALKGGALSLTDTKGRMVLVPGEKIAYVEVGNATVGAVGFR
ncbi:DUF3107 domain-containing protein [Nocardioides sp. Y6]|uniref:DUF3107 domain-containing protein n=1 Tax=Nocardioides malaquae TaxID=2773426 RepID=A0ABR9RPI9_9ACTN|nr:DUF3107 domain-containing protein [Nocardioides malaquae]MBE7323496.1 DUF3107 domain-containing protein [Nocardioides malaquae]